LAIFGFPRRQQGVVGFDERNKVVVWKIEKFFELFVFEVHWESDKTSFV
jgi:hypothetical protein